MGNKPDTKKPENKEDKEGKKGGTMGDGCCGGGCH